MKRVWIHLSILCVTALTSVARGSGAGLTNIGTLSTGATGVTGARQWIRLRQTGHLLFGEVGEGTVEFLTISAPGVETGNVILREIEFPDGGKSILLSGQADLQASVERVCIYVRGDPRSSVLLQYHDGDWTEHRPNPVPPNSNDSASRDEVLLEFCVDGLGQFHLLGFHVRGDSGRSPILPSVTAHGLVGGGMSRGLWHLGWAIGLLGLLAGGSHWAHVIQSRRS